MSARHRNDRFVRRKARIPSSAQAIEIPYRANRAVIFGSDLSHGTQPAYLRNDYAGRRVNVLGNGRPQREHGAETPLEIRRKRVLCSLKRTTDRSSAAEPGEFKRLRGRDGRSLEN
jgi:hypothetical protein